jgi:hypothetical protein
LSLYVDDDDDVDDDDEDELFLLLSRRSALGFSWQIRQAQRLAACP